MIKITAILILLAFYIPAAAATGPVAHWKLDETSGSIAYDSAGNNDGTLYGNPVWTTGQIDGALEFDGSDDYVEMDVTDYKGVLGTQSRTCAALIKTTGTGAIVSWGDSDISGGWWLFWVEGDGRLRLNCQGGHRRGNTDLRDNNWHHVAAVLADDGSPNNNEVKLYVDGVEETYSSVTGQPINTASHSNVTIGASYIHDGSVVVPFTGRIDDVHIYDRALSKQEVEQLYLEGLGDNLWVTPLGDFDSSGEIGGPFTPASKDYQLYNNSDDTLSWDLQYSATWLDVSDTAGTLNPNESVMVTVSINATAETLGRDIYTDTLVFKNITDPANIIVSATRYISLKVAGTIYVKKGASGTGSSWSDAYGSLQEALDIAIDGDQIWVAKGTYKPTTKAGGSGNRNKTFQMKNGVAIYGGFAGTETALSQRDVKRNETILSGDLLGNDNPATPVEELYYDPSRSDNCYHVFYHPQGTDLDSTAVLDGFTITGGNADVSGTHGTGGGMYNEGSNPTITNCTFSNNFAGVGGGMANYEGGKPAVTGCNFTDNASLVGGGGLGNVGKSGPTVTNCTFDGNWAELYGGGGILNYQSNPTVTDCTFIGNSTDEDGGGMYNWENSSPIVTNCTFIDNSAKYDGGGMYNRSSSSPKVTNCTFSNNSAGEGGGMYSLDSNPTVTNCAFNSNSGYYGGGGMYSLDSSPVVTNCTFSSNSSAAGGGMNNKNSSPIVTGCAFSGNSSNWNGGGMSNNSSSVTVSNCNFIGNSILDDWVGGAGGGGGMFNYKTSLKVNNCTFTENTAYKGAGGITIDSSSNVTLTNCILWGNRSPKGGNEIRLRRSSSIINVDHCDVRGGSAGIYNDGSGNTINWGSGNIDANPLFTDPVIRDYHLLSDSPCIDAGDNSVVAEVTDQDGKPRINDGDNNGTATVDMGAYEYGPIEIYVDDNAIGANDGSSWEDAFNNFYDALDIALPSDKIFAAEGTYLPDTSGLTNPRQAHFQMKNFVTIEGGFAGYGATDPDQRNVEFYETIFSGDIGIEDDSSDNCYHVFYHPEGTNLDATAILDGFTITAGNANSNLWPRKAGGGMLNLNSSPTVISCTFRENSAEHGGGMYNGYSSSPTAIACTFSSNTAISYGGGIENYRSNPTVTNCIFNGNQSGGYGGGMFNYFYSDPEIVNCTFGGNSAKFGGGICNFLNKYRPSVINSILWGNIADRGNEIALHHSSTIDIDHCDVKGGQAGIYDDGSNNIINWGEGNFDYDPLFVDAENGDLHLLPDSPCIDAGDNDVVEPKDSHWKLDEASGPTAYDSAGNNDGTFYGNLVWTTGQIDGALEFDGIDDYVEMDVTNYKGFLGTRSRTCAAWIKTTGTGAIVSWGDSDISGGWWLFRVEDAGRLRLQTQGGRIVGNTDLRDNNWHHVAAVLADDGSPDNDEVKLYVDGVEEIYSEIDSQPIDTASHSNVTIGASYLHDGTVVVPFNGLIDDVRIYDRALSAKEIQQFYQGDNSVVTEITDLDGNLRIIDGDGDGLAIVDMGAYEFIPSIEAIMKLTPQTLNCSSEGNWVKAHFVLPEGFSTEDVDTDKPATIDSLTILSDHMNVSYNNEGVVEIEVAFSRNDFCSIGLFGNIELTVRGWFTDQTAFYGTDTIRITTNKLELLLDFSAYWLQTDCAKPDWCDGFDLDHNGVVDLADFALLAEN